jgi:hypothetical protein
LDPYVDLFTDFWKKKKCWWSPICLRLLGSWRRSACLQVISQVFFFSLYYITIIYMSYFTTAIIICS